MSSNEPADTSAIDPHVADAVERAETYRTMLERLAVVGMAVAEEIGKRAVNAPYHPEVRHEPGRAFANVSRAVRLTIALCMRIDKDILAMRKGGTPSTPKVAAPPSAPGFAPEPRIDPRRAKIRGAVWTAINREVSALAPAVEALDRVHESLIEREDYDDLLERPWRECVEAICDDLGLEPDWSLWSDDTGFPVETGPHKDWPLLWAYDPRLAEERRRMRAEPPPARVPEVVPSG
jgi:hypothetical protein